MPGPPPTPSAFRALHGNPGHRPINRREPKPAPADATPPAWLSKGATAIWADLAPELVRLGCLGVPDVRTLATACRLQAMGDHYAAIAERQMVAKVRRPSPALWAAVKCWEKALGMFTRFGITPAERSRLAVGDGEPDDPLARFRQQKPRARRPA